MSTIWKINNGVLNHTQNERMMGQKKTRGPSISTTRFCSPH